MIFMTDIGKDIDDAVALTLAIVLGIPIRTIVVTSVDLEESAHICRNILDGLSGRYPRAKGIQIVLGTRGPIQEGVSHGNTYHGPFTKSEAVYAKYEASKTSPGDVIAIGPMTDLVSLLALDRVNRVMYMGQATKDGVYLRPDMSAYNFRCDPLASERCFQYQDKVPFGFIGKSLAYQVPLVRDDFEALAGTRHPVGEFLRDHALVTHEVFKKRMPDLYKKIYEGTDNISYCYDPLVVLAMAKPSLFTFEEFGDHRIGVDIDADMSKDYLISTLVAGLC